MSEQNNNVSEEAQKALQEAIEQNKNKVYPDWDNIVIQLNKGDEAVLNIRMMRQDLEAMTSFHGTERKDVLEMMIAAMEEQIKERENK